jgi:hypothetical protein
MDKMVDGKEIKAAKCANPVSKQFQLGQSIGVNGTPAIVLADGQVIPGYQPAPQVAKLALASNPHRQRRRSWGVHVHGFTAVRRPFNGEFTVKPVKVGICGLGTVGGGTFNVLQRNAEEIARRAGRGIEVAQIAMRSPKPQFQITGIAITNDVFEVATTLRSTSSSS